MRKMIAAFLLMIGGAAVATERPVPELAARLIATVHGAATAGNADSLRTLMAPDFVSSFGGDGGPEEALALWASDPIYLQHLASVTSNDCGYQPPDYVECPRGAGTGYRAGFKLVGDKWLFAYFVAGD